MQQGRILLFLFGGKSKNGGNIFGQEVKYFWKLEMFWKLSFFKVVVIKWTYSYHPGGKTSKMSAYDRSIFVVFL